MSVTGHTSGFSLRSIISHFFKRRRDARAIRSLADLPDSVLADIGITRFDVRSAMHASWRETPSSVLERTALEKRALQQAANEVMRRSLQDGPIALAA
jgi:uncharacterized protein YjiS (DUF1127 family)